MTLSARSTQDRPRLNVVERCIRLLLPNTLWADFPLALKFRRSEELGLSLDCRRYWALILLTRQPTAALRRAGVPQHSPSTIHPLLSGA